MTHPLSFADISIFSTEINKFCYIKKYRHRLHFGTQFLVLLTFFEFFNKYGYKFVDFRKNDYSRPS